MPVGIFAERSIQLVVAILAILKAGGVYVPLDPDFPSQRLSAIIEDSQIGLLIIDSALKTRLPPELPHVIDLDESAPAVTAESSEFVAANLTPENLAYIVYTSGSTGKPKGVLLPHRVFMRCDYWARDVFHFTSDDRFLFKSIRAPEELLYQLFIGASVFVAPAGAERDPALFVSTIIKHRITAVG